MLRLKHLTKVYPGVVALDDVSLDFAPGEVHALMGENGAGKSTLIKIIAGAIEPTSGEVEIDGESFEKMTPALASSHGISVIYQDIILVQPLTVAENIFLGQNTGKTFSLKKMKEKAKAIIDEYGFDLDPGAIVYTLSPASQELVEICKAISQKAKLIIMDEPTASLASNEVDQLFKVIKTLKEKGMGVIYISHRLDEVFAISEKISILRDGKFIATVKTSETSRKDLITYMVGRQLDEHFPSREYKPQEVVLKADKLTGNKVHDISFELHKGEILGLAGLVGSGRTETAQLIAGSKKLESGSLYVKGRKVAFIDPSDSIGQGIGLIPEERKKEGCIIFNTILFNITLSAKGDCYKYGWIHAKKREEIAKKYKDALSIKTPDVRTMVNSLSGGNQQKVIVAKEMAADLDIVIFDEPTKGIDVGAKHEIYELMDKMTKEGKSIIMISSDMEEILGMSDRIVVLYEGGVSGELQKNEFSQENVLKLASGIKKEAAL
jgi:ribose transport system ATP-binding protein